MDWSETTLESPTGARLHLYSALAGGAARGVVQINHGMGEHAGRYRRFAQSLTARGYHVYAHDHRGHGKTVAEGAPLGRFAPRGGWGLVLSDVAAVNMYIRAAHEGLPVICFGHSMGSIIAFNYALTHPESIDALSCWNASFTAGGLAAIGKAILNVERLVKGAGKPSPITRSLTFGAWNKTFKLNRTEFDWLSRDAQEVDKYVADPLCGFPISTSLWLDTIDGVYFAHEDANLGALSLDLPVHLQGGTADPGSDKGTAVTRTAARLQKAGLGNVTLNLLAGARHESLNEINREEITAEYIDWLDAQFKQG